MAYCTNCGGTISSEQFCTQCGASTAVSGPTASKPSSNIPPVASIARSEAVSSSESVVKRKNPLVIYGSIAGALVLLLVIAIGSANRWEKIDVPEQPETFRSETYLTGNYDVVDSDVNPCWIGQDWTDCINAHVDTYNAACTTVPLTSSGLTFCSQYLGMIDEMKAQGGYGWTVTSLGGWGYLIQVPEEATESVSNNDYRPAVTHEAVCYLGFLGECE